MNLTALIAKQLWRRPSRSLLTISGLAVAVGAVVALVGIAAGFQRTFHDLYQGHGIDLVVTRVGVTDRMASSLDEAMAARIRSVPGVADVAGQLLDVVSFEEQALYGVVVQGLEPTSWMTRELKMLDGRTLVAGDDRVVLLGRVLAELLGKRTGDTLEVVVGESFRVAGVYESYNVFENGAIIMPLAALQSLMQRPQQITWINVRLTDATRREQVEQVRQAIENLHPSLAAMPAADYIQTDARVRAATGMAWATSLIALCVGAIGVLNTMVMSVMERTQEIGILRALGWRPASIARLVIGEAIALCLAGAVVGTIGAWLLVRAMTWSPTLATVVDPRLNLAVVLQGLGIATVVGIGGAIYPAWRAAGMLPTAALRHE